MLQLSHLSHLWSVICLATGIPSLGDVIPVGLVQGGDEAVLGHHPVKVLHPTSRISIIQIQEERSPVTISP